MQVLECEGGDDYLSLGMTLRYSVGLVMLVNF